MNVVPDFEKNRAKDKTWGSFRHQLQVEPSEGRRSPRKCVYAYIEKKAGSAQCGRLGGGSRKGEQEEGAGRGWEENSGLEMHLKGEEGAGRTLPAESQMQHVYTHPKSLQGNRLWFQKSLGMCLAGKMLSHLMIWGGRRRERGRGMRDEG